MTDSTQLRLEQEGERWALTGTDARRFESVNDYLGYLADRNYSPERAAPTATACSSSAGGC
jgi:hypothetical protein